MQNLKTFIRMFKQLNKMLVAEEKRKAVCVAILSFFSAFLETLGVSAILPLVLALLQPETLMSYPKISYVLGLFHITSEKGMVFFVGTGVILIYVVKNIYIVGYNRYRLNFRNRLENNLSILMLDSYIRRPYTFFLKADSGEILRGVINDNAAVVQVLDGYCGLLNEGLTCVMIGVVLVMINPVMAVTVLILAGIIAIVMTLVLKKKIGVYASETREAYAERFKCVNESVNGIKEIDVMKRQDMFVNRFSRISTVACENNTKYLWISMLPSRVIETVFLAGLIIIILAIYREDADMTVIAAQFSALAVAAIRILPAISNISGAINTLVYNRPGFEGAYENIVNNGLRLDNRTESGKTQLSGTPRLNDAIVIDNISWRYDENLPNILDDLSLVLRKGESIGIIGESGAGKTTLADAVLGVLRPQSGIIDVDGKSIYEEETEWCKMIGYVPQNVFLLDDSIKNNILFGIPEEDLDEKKLSTAIEKAQLKKFVEDQRDGIDAILGERGVRISGGQRQRIAIARALYYDPDVLVLDEATSALDNDTENAVIEAINALHGEKTLIIIAHRLSTIEKCDRIFEIKDGKAICRR